MTKINPVNQSLCLQMLCESNYERLKQLLPPLDTPFNQTPVYREGNVLMEVSELDRTPYTLTLQLNPTQSATQTSVSRFRLHVYLDAEMVEVLDIGNPLNQQRPAADACPYERMQHKWVLNYFLDKWLGYLLFPSALDQPSHSPALSEP